MAIRLNGVEITSNKLNGSDVLEEKLNGTVVYSFSPTTTTAKWQFAGSYSSQPDRYDVLAYQDINGDYRQGIQYLDINYPVVEFDQNTLGEYNQAHNKLDVIVPEGVGAEDVMYAFITQHNQWYTEYVVDSSGRWNYVVEDLALRADDGLGYSYWKLRATGNYYDGFVAVIADQSTLDYYEYVVVG